MLDQDTIKGIMQSLAETEKAIFSNESQFQFAFTLSLLCKKLSGCDIVVEYPYKYEGKRKYIDIVVFFHDAESYVCFPIELKYKTFGKTIEYKIEDIPYYTYNQGGL